MAPRMYCNSPSPTVGGRGVSTGSQGNDQYLNGVSSSYGNISSFSSPGSSHQSKNQNGSNGKISVLPPAPSRQSKHFVSQSAEFFTGLHSAGGGSAVASNLVNGTLALGALKSNGNMGLVVGGGGSSGTSSGSSSSSSGGSRGSHKGVSSPMRKSSSTPRVAFAETPRREKERDSAIKRALCSNDAEEIKNIGNVLYKKGRYVEALQLYDRAVLLTPEQAIYHANRAAALIRLGRLLEAVDECEEAIRLDFGYTRAHQRLAGLYLRLGRFEDVKKYFVVSNAADVQEDWQRLDRIIAHLAAAENFRKAGDWDSVLLETNAAMSIGADSVPKMLRMRAEAFLKLRQPSEADMMLKSAAKCERKNKSKLVDSNLAFLQTNVDLALGRFEDAVQRSETALLMDPDNVQVQAIVKKCRALSRARMKGNSLFSSGDYKGAAAAYSEGLRIDSWSPILLCNRSACWSHMGKWNEALYDCNSALKGHPTYTKAMIRRALCYLKLGRWAEAVKEYEALARDNPDDLDIQKQLADTKVAYRTAMSTHYSLMPPNPGPSYGTFPPGTPPAQPSSPSQPPAAMPAVQSTTNMLLPGQHSAGMGQAQQPPPAAAPLTPPLLNQIVPIGKMEEEKRLALSQQSAAAGAGAVAMQQQHGNVHGVPWQKPELYAVTGELKVKNPEHFKQLIGSYGVVVVDFTATWCEESNHMASTLQQMIRQCRTVRFLMIDLDEVPALGLSEGIEWVPTFHLFKNGVRCSKVVGANAAELQRQVQQHVAY